MSFQTLVKDTICGCASGVAQVITMMPIENIITKMISKPDQYPNFIQATTKTIKQQGLLSFYKGMLMPLLGVGFQVSIQFAVVQTLKKIMKENFADENGKLGSKYIFASGVIAGIPSGLTVTPLDHARFRVLMRGTKDGPGSVRTAIDIYNQYGIRKLFLGLNSTVLRQCIGLAIYFTVYDMLLPKILQFKFDHLLSAFTAGGLAGICTWLAIYPIHYAKVKIQTDSLDKPKYKSTWDCAKQIYQNKQIGKMYKGVGWMLLRAYLVNGAGFVGFEITKRFLYKNQKM